MLPAGLVGKAARVPRCSGANFATLTPGAANLCPENTAIGIAVASVEDPIIVGYLQATVPVFNLTPEEGEPARFGFEIHNVPVVLTTHVRSGKDYGVEVTVNEATQSAAVLATQLTLWGVPNDPRHDAERGWECLEGGSWVAAEKECKTGAEIEKEENKKFEEEEKPLRTEPEAFLTMPDELPGKGGTGAALDRDWRRLERRHVRSGRRGTAPVRIRTVHRLRKAHVRTEHLRLARQNRSGDPERLHGQRRSPPAGAGLRQRRRSPGGRDRGHHADPAPGRLPERRRLAGPRHVHLQGLRLRSRPSNRNSVRPNSRGCSKTTTSPKTRSTPKPALNRRRSARSKSNRRCSKKTSTAASNTKRTVPRSTTPAASTSPTRTRSRSARRWSSTSSPNRPSPTCRSSSRAGSKSPRAGS